MKNLWGLLVLALFLAACGGGGQEPATDDSQAATDSSMTMDADDDFEWQTEQFADLKIIRYQIPGWDKLSLDQKKLVYYLTQAGLSGRDIMYDQNYRHNLEIRKALENIYINYAGDKTSDDWKNFEVYLKRIWFSNGIHHHYANTKHTPEFSQEYFSALVSETNTTLSEEAMTAMFDASVDAKKVEQDPNKGLVESSAVNFYAPDVTTEEAKAYFASITDPDDRAPISIGLNSRLIKNAAGEVVEDVYKVGGLYGPALEKVIYWLGMAESVAENDKQAAALRNLIEYYETGDLRKWDVYNINWVQDTEGDIDYINGFVEVYNDPLGYTGSYETVVQIKDFAASDRMSVLMNNAQYFETNSPIMDEHKKEEVVGITYNVVNVAGEAGDASPSTPIGVNLPNANWIRVKHGSKSVSLGNIVNAYDKASGSGMLDEFAHDAEEIERAKANSELAGKLHTAMHEVIGHASGKLEESVGTPNQTLLEHSSTIEEGRADLVALYYLLDPKMVELGLMESLEVGMAEYDGYIRNGMLTQLRRLELGADIEEAHMRNRAWVSNWVYEKGMADSVIVKVIRDGKHFYDIQDYDKLRVLFGDLLKEVQRIKSKGDYEAAKELVEGYGVKVDQDVHTEVLERTEKLGIAPYGGFINPVLQPVTDAQGNITDIEVVYPDDFVQQMLFYSTEYGHL
ncbi:MAG: dipeptidyl peptidase 3 [Flavobacteriales bacterium]|nr:dipeptidyl peptidase 3 [Flavobacteriales bacterium]